MLVVQTKIFQIQISFKIFWQKLSSSIMSFSFHQLSWQLDLSLTLEHSSAGMPFNSFHWVFTHQWSHGHQSNLGHGEGHITKLTHCLLYSTWGGYVGHTPPKQLLIWTSPLSHKLIKYHIKLVWLIPVLIINLEDYICYTFSLFLLYFWQWQMHHCCFE